MNIVGYLLDVYSHMEWADSMVWAAVRATPAAESDRRLRELLVHIHVVQRAFLSLWRGEPVVGRRADDFATLASVEAWAREYYPAAMAHLAGIDDEALATTVVLPWAGELERHMGRVPAPTTLADTLLQVPSHTTYHRGQINVKLRELGGEPPLVDYIAWGWFGRPAAAWPAGV